MSNYRPATRHDNPYTFKVTKVVKVKTMKTYFHWIVFEYDKPFASGNCDTKEQAEQAGKAVAALWNLRDEQSMQLFQAIGDALNAIP